MRNLNHTDLINAVAEESGQSPKIVDKVLRATFDVIGRHVVAGFKVNVTNFGTWYRSEVAPRIRHVPGTEESWHARRTNYPRFRYAPKFRDATVSGDVPATLRKRGH
jgi:nucleoid DNA-binding protein